MAPGWPDSTATARFRPARSWDAADPQHQFGVIATATNHNGPCRGGIVTIDPTQGANSREAVRNLTPEIDIYAHRVGGGPYGNGMLDCGIRGATKAAGHRRAPLPGLQGGRGPNPRRRCPRHVAAGPKGRHGVLQPAACGQADAAAGPPRHGHGQATPNARGRQRLRQLGPRSSCKTCTTGWNRT